MVRTYVVLLVLTAGTICFACGGYGSGEFGLPTADEMREMGPKGLEQALRIYNSDRMNIKKSKPGELETLRESVDQIAGQRHAWISRLYWYTDLEKAKAAAAESGKPILSLRVLGKLTDEFSCANSRFFRTALYANESISKTMRDNFVLHWQSVRPVPKVTIDFGDGRKLERTVTGNSAHYVLDAEGRPLDVLPGLYSPKEFQAWLDRVGTWYTAGQKAKHQFSYASAVSIYHQLQHQQLLERWQSDLKQAGLESTVSPPRLIAAGTTPNGEFPAAAKAAAVAVAKGRYEGPLITVLGQSPMQVESRLNGEAWQQIAALHRPDTELDRQSVALMRMENPNALQAGALAASKRLVEDPILRVVRNFENSIALDTVRNEYLLHRQIHEWFIDGSALTDVESLNERVYAELFLTPSSDPWLGLVPKKTYTALSNDGLNDSSSTVSHFGKSKSLDRITAEPIEASPWGVDANLETR